jgi:RNA polymerase sigma-70 factor (ECF subfamily)
MSDDTRFGMPAAEEHRLLSRARRGDHDAYASIVRHHLRAIYRLAFALMRDPVDAAVVVRETFVRGEKGIRYMAEGQPTYPWLARIAYNLALSSARRWGMDDAARAAHLPAVERGRLTAEDARRYLVALEALEPEDQLAIALRVAERLPYGDVEAVLQTAPGSVLSRLSRARGTLREALDPGEERAAA